MTGHFRDSVTLLAVLAVGLLFGASDALLWFVLGVTAVAFVLDVAVWKDDRRLARLRASWIERER